MATSRTRSELVLEALVILGVSGVGNPAQTEDIAYVDGNVDSTLADLAARRIIDVSDAATIPMEWFTSLAICLAEDSAGRFGRPRNGQAKQMAEADLSRKAMSGPTYEPLQVNYF